MTPTRSSRALLAALFGLAIAACSDLEPRIARFDAGPTATDAGDASDVGAAEVSAADADTQTADAASPWPKACIDLPNHEFYETGCAQTMTCTNGQLSGVWSGPVGAGSSTLVFTDALEGQIWTRIDCTDGLWCGVTDECPQNAPSGPKSVDLSGWKTLHIGLKGNATDVELKVASLPVDSDDWRDEAAVVASAYGYKPDGAWHELLIPLADFKQKASDKPNHPIDWSKIYKPLVIGLLDMTDPITYSIGVDAVYVTK